VSEERPRSSTFFRIRVGVLLFVLFVVVLYAIRDVRSRRQRNEWDHTLTVAVVLLRQGAVSPEAIVALKRRRADVEGRLTEEMRRYRPAGPVPFTFALFGPVDVTAPPPQPASDGVVDIVRHVHEQWRYLRDVDRTAGLSARDFDTRIYVTLKPGEAGETSFVEGLSEAGGRIGTVGVDLDTAMVDVAWFVTVHELFHTLGATDRYDATGRTVLPDGLADPAQSPLYPQRFTEIMARNRPLSLAAETPPDSIDEIAVGAKTAKEIGWVR
jgi:hypothetical protein